MTLIDAQGYGRGEPSSNPICLPKAARKPLPIAYTQPNPSRNTKFNQLSAKSTPPRKPKRRWILRQLLQAQGNYKGDTSLWLPKMKA